MTESFDQKVRDHVATEARRVEYEKGARDRAELRRIEGQREEMEAHLRRRGEAFLEQTGMIPSREVAEGWMVEYADQREGERQTENRRLTEEADAEVF